MNNEFCVKRNGANLNTVAVDIGDILYVVTILAEDMDGVYSPM